MADIVVGQTIINNAEADYGPRPSSEQGFRRDKHIPPKFTTEGKEIH